MDILCTLEYGLRCSAFRKPSSPCHCCSHSAFPHGKEPVSLTHLEMWSDKKLCNVDYRCQYSTAAALPFPLKKLYTNIMSAHYELENVQKIVHRTSLQHNTTTFTKTYKHTGHHTVTVVPPQYTTLAQNLKIQSNWPTVYRTLFCWKWPLEHVPKVCWICNGTPCTRKISKHNLQIVLLCQ
jgi:hypothetical protein